MVEFRRIMKWPGEVGIFLVQEARSLDGKEGAKVKEELTVEDDEEGGSDWGRGGGDGHGVVVATVSGAGSGEF